MAVFNPQIQPTQDPNYLNYSRVLDAPTPDLSGKIGLDTAATTLDSAVTVTDQAIKKGISDKAYEAVDPLRDKMTAGLEQIKRDLNQGVLPQKAAGATGKSWLDANAMAPDAEDNLPVGLADSLSGVQAMAAAKMAGSPKLNDTQYAGEVLSEAKRLRNMYGPGYREYIDQKISEASGLPVANSYYNNMLLDINRQMSQMNKTKDDIGASLIKSNDMPGQANLLLKYKANPQDPALQSEILHKINDWENLKSQGQLDAAARAATDWQNKDLITKQTESMGRQLNGVVLSHMSALKDASLPGGGQGKDLAQFLTDAAAGKHPEISETALNQRRLQFNGWVSQVEAAVNATAAAYAPVVGDTSTAVKNAMASLKAQQAFFNNKEDGPAYFITRQNEHIKADATSGILLNKDYGQTASQMLGARAVLGEQYFPDWLKSMTADGVIEKFKGIVSQEGMAAITPFTDTRGQPIPRYHKDAIVHGVAIGAGDLNPEYLGPNGVTKVVTKIADPNMPLAAKDKLIDYAFNPKNVGRLEELKMDYRDPQTGNWVDGKYRMFNILASAGINKGVLETSLVHPDNYKVYQKTLEVEFGRLYRSTLIDLNKAISPDKAYLGVHFSFNDKTNTFGLVDNHDRPIPDQSRLPAVQYPNARYIMGLQDKLSLLNSGISNLARIQANNPAGAGDTPQYLLQTMQTLGFRPGYNITGATEGMMKAVIRSRNPDIKPEELDKLLLGSQGPAARSQ